MLCPFVRFLSSSTGGYAALLVITLFAAALRFYQLGTWSFWIDKAFTLSFKEDGFNYSLWRQSLALTLIHAATATLGASEWSARLAPALIGVLSIPLLYFLLRRLFGSTVALLSVSLLALSPWHLYWSQNARFYSLLLLFYTLALLTAYWGFETDRPAYLLLSLLFLGLAARERLLALFFVPVLASYLLLVQFSPFTRPPGWRLHNFAVFLLPGAVLALFFCGPYLQDFSGWLAGFRRINNNPFWIIAGTVYYIGLPLVCVAATGALYLLGQGNRAALFFSLGALIPLLAIAALAPFHYTANRYIFVSLTSWLVLASLAIQGLWQAVSRRAVLPVAGVVLLLMAQPLSEDLLYFRYQNGNRDNWRAAFAYIAEHKSKADVVVSADQSIGEYYLQSETMDWSDFDPAARPRTSGRIWFVEDMNAAAVHPQLFAWIQQHAQQMADFDVQVRARNFKMRVYLYDPAKPTVMR